MIRLRDLRVDAEAWDASADFVVPPFQRYNIATDCLDHRHDSTAIIEGETTLNFEELSGRTAALAQHLTAAGVAPGSRVAIKLSQSIDMAVAVLGVVRCGAIAVPLSNVLAPCGLQHRLSDAAPHAVIAVDGDDVFALAPGVQQVPSSVLGALTPFPAALPDTRADQPALLLYTSGTTGRPKGVLHAHRVLLGHHAIDLALDRVRVDDVAYSPVDWSWAGGLLLGLLVPLAHGVPVVAHREPRFDAVATLELIRRTGVSIGLFPPTVLRMLRASGAMTADSVARTRLRCFVTGAEAVEPALISWGRQVGITVNNAYGQTEANALVGHTATLRPPLDQSTMGRPYPGHRIGVLDDDLQPVGDGTPGQLAVAADDPVCMLEYWNDPGATAAKRRGGWLLTGDTVHRLPDGTLRFHGRSDDIIKSGAYRLGPAEIEAAMLRHDDVVECAAIGVPDQIRGEVVAAVVRVRDAGVDRDELTAALQQLVRAGVGAHAYPRVVHVVDQLPKTTTNKVDRAALRRSMPKEAG